jgi:hypothetical protein
MTFEPTLIIFLFLYLGFIGIFFIFSIIHIYHIFLSASFTTVSFIVITGILGATLCTILITGYLLLDTNWQQPIFEQSSPNNNFSSFSS